MKSDIGRYGIMPEWVLLSGISARAIQVYGLLSARYADRDTGECWPARRTLAKEAGVASPRTIDAAIEELVGVGALQIEERGGATGEPQATNLYRVQFTAPPLANNSEGGSQRIAKAPSQPIATKPESYKPESNHPDISPPPPPRPGGGSSEKNESPNLALISKTHMETFGGRLNSAQGEILKEWAERIPLGNPAIPYAYAQTSLQEQPDLRYVLGIWKRLEAEGWPEQMDHGLNNRNRQNGDQGEIDWLKQQFEAGQARKKVKA